MMKWYELAIIGLIALGLLSKREEIPTPEEEIVPTPIVPIVEEKKAEEEVKEAAEKEQLMILEQPEQTVYETLKATLLDPTKSLGEPWRYYTLWGAFVSGRITSKQYKELYQIYKTRINPEQQVPIRKVVRTASGDYASMIVGYVTIPAGTYQQQQDSVRAKYMTGISLDQAIARLG